MSKMKACKMVSFLGNKWSTAKHYPAPKYDHIIEPFAGFAGYSLNYPSLKVSLYDRDDYVCAVWDYLIHASVEEIKKLPDYPEKLEDYPELIPEAKLLIGYWLNPTSAVSRKRASPWTKTLWEKGKNFSVWCPVIRDGIADNLEKIRHWTIQNRSYKDVDNERATWFIDPPYQLKGKYYRCSSKSINFEHLGPWCSSREGQVMVCENVGAEWLDFDFLRKVNVTASGVKDVEKSAEAIYYQEDGRKKEF